MRIDELTLSRAAEGMKTGEFSPVELTEFFLQRISNLNPTINAFITITQQQALKDAKEAEDLLKRGRYLGPLHGIPIALKDLYETIGVKTTGGSKIQANHIPTADAFVVRRLREQGAVIVGKANLHEWAVGVTNINPHYGTTHNPWNKDRVPGGSSGGCAAALVSRMCLGALGTDTGGSVRIPAAACGVVGLKPTRGLISLTGVMQFSWSLDHAGPMALRVEDCALLLDAITGYDPADPESIPRPTAENYHQSIHRPIEGLRVAVPKNYFFDAIDDTIANAVQDAVKVLERLGAHVSEVSYPDVEEDARVSGVIRVTEGATVHQRDLIERRGEIGADVLERLGQGMRTSPMDYVLAKRTQATKTRVRAGFFEEYDLLATPTIPIEPPPISGIDPIQAASELTRFTSPFNLTGLPAISLPCGFSPHALPIGLQLVAGNWKESVLLSAANAYEEATDWKNRKPAL